MHALKTLTATFAKAREGRKGELRRWTFWLLCDSFEVGLFDPAWAELLFENSRRGLKVCALFDFIERVLGKFLHFQKLLPMCEITVTIAVVHDAVSEVFCDSGKLSELFYAGSVDVNRVWHSAIYPNLLDELGLEKVLHWLGKEQLSNVNGIGNHVEATESNVRLTGRNSAAG